jgi:hypothetical protein
LRLHFIHRIPAPYLTINLLVALLADTHDLAILMLDADARGLAALGADQHNVRNIKRGFEMHFARVNIASLSLDLALVLGAYIQALHNNPAFSRDDPNNFTTLALFFDRAADEFYGIPFVYLYLHGFAPVTVAPR